jgi:hypothetical protein
LRITTKASEKCSRERTKGKGTILLAVLLIRSKVEKKRKRRNN